MEQALLTELNAERRARRAVVTVTDIREGTVRLVREAGDIPGDPLAADIAERFRSGRPGLVGTAFINVFLPPPRLIVIGAVHITQALAEIAHIGGLEVIVVDPRTGFATKERFPGVDLRSEWPEAVLPRMGVDRFTGLAALTHDPKIDDFAIAYALERRCFYVGALGSRKTQFQRLKRLSEAGVPASDLERIRAPIGLDIGAATPAEIALAVVAEVIVALRRPV